MAIKDAVKVNRKTFFDPRSWLGFDAIKQQTLDIIQMCRLIYVFPTTERIETFDEAVQRLSLSESDITERKEAYLLYCFIFLAVALVTFLFSFYLLFHNGVLTGWLLGMSLVGLLLAQAFRYHFWYFQLKHRKLGCTFEEWKNGTLDDDSGELKP